MGKNLDKICEGCAKKPTIPGRRWTDHCKVVHQTTGNGVKFTYAEKTCSENAQENIAISTNQKQDGSLSFPIKESFTVQQHGSPENGQFQEVDKHSQPNSFSTNYVTDWEKLSRTCSSLSQMSEAAKLLLQEKDKTILELKDRLNKLEEKLEMKQNTAHSQCNKIMDDLMLQLSDHKEEKTSLKEEYECKLQAKEQQIEKVRVEAYNQGMEVFKQVYEICKNKAEREQIRDIVTQKFSRTNSVVLSPQWSPTQSQYTNSDHDEMDAPLMLENTIELKAIINENNAVKPSETKCSYCTYITSKPLYNHYLECDLKQRFNDVIVEYGKQWKQVLSDNQQQHIHIFEHPQFKQMFEEFMQGLSGEELNNIKQLQYDLMKANDIDPESMHGHYHCSMCRVDFTSFGVRFQHYQFCVGLKKHYAGIKRQLQAYKDHVSEEEGRKIQSVISFDGKVLRGVIDSVNLIKELSPSKKKAKEVWGDNYKKTLELYKQLYDKDYFKEAWLELIAGPIADADGNPVYAQYTTRENLINVLGKRRRCKNTKIAREVIVKTKQELGIPLTLMESKVQESVNICKLIEENSGLFKQFQEWMKKHKVEKVLNKSNVKKFEWVGPAFCDGIIVPKLPIFKNNYDYQAFLQKHGKLQIQKITDAANLDCLYVRLLDSANQFTAQLIEGLNNINNELLSAMKQHLNIQQHSPFVADETLSKCHIIQVDYTRDMKGAFYSYNMKTDFDMLSKLLGMRKATHDEYTSIDSCFHFLKHAKGEKKELRMKFYNKIFHLIQSEQGKKKVSMNLKALINCSAAFFEKINDCIDEGLSRCEFSQYSSSIDDLSQKLKLDDCIVNLDKALDTLNQVPSVYNTIPPIQFLDDYFQTFAIPLFIFEKHQWAVVYGKNRLSTYMGIIGNPCKMGKAEFIARYSHSGIIHVIDNSDESDLPKNTLTQARRIGPQVMQIPMQALGVTHKINNLFELDHTKLRLTLSQEEVNQIRIVDEEENPFFKAAQNKSKAHKTLKLKPVKPKLAPFSKAKPRKMKRNNTEFLLEQFNCTQNELNGFEAVKDFMVWSQQDLVRQKKREEKKIEKQTQQWRKRGMHKSGKQRWECKVCSFMTTDIDKHHRCKPASKK